MKLKISILIITLLLISSCATRIPLSKNYFIQDKKVGIIQIKHEITNYRTGSQGLLEYAITPGNKYEEPLKVVDEVVNPTQKIYDLYNTIYSSKGIELKIIDEILDFKTLNKFTKPKKSKKKFYKYDLNYLTNKYDIDEILVVDVKYGVMISYYSVIETGRSGYCQILSEIINLDDNSYIYKDFSISSDKIKGKWKNPPKYEKLQESIENAVNEGIQIEKKKFK